MRTFMTFEERFWSKVNRKGDDDCWEWVGAGAKTKHGYGRIRVNEKMRQVTHVAWELTYGESVPTELVMRHNCDNPLCVNPRHLLVGTRSESVLNAIAKGRFKLNLTPQEGRKFSDEFNPSRKLTQSEVDEIRSRYKDGNVFQRELALEYKVTRANIGLIVRGKTWQE
jgi:hypothetical protein